MSKRFKLSLRNFFRSCRPSKDNYPSQPLRSSSLFRRRPSSWHVLDDADEGAPSSRPPRYPSSSTSDAFVPPPFSAPFIESGPAAKGKKQPQRRAWKKKASMSMPMPMPMSASALLRPRVSTSSRSAADTCLFSSGFDASTDFSPHLETIREGPNKQPLKRIVSNRISMTTMEERLSDEVIVGEVDAPARLSSVLQRLMPCSAEGKVRESFAVVKRSDDPYEDFRRSMAEMIVEKEMVEEADLRQLLRCFLSLNSDHHHAVIMAAFSDISNAFFSTNSRISYLRTYL